LWPAAERFDDAHSASDRQILVVFAIMMLGLWAATQWAAMLPLSPEFGPRWFRLGYLLAYRPWNSSVRG
jgi:hypothetical protein